MGPKPDDVPEDQIVVALERGQSEFVRKLLLGYLMRQDHPPEHGEFVRTIVDQFEQAEGEG